MHALGQIYSINSNSHVASELFFLYNPVHSKSLGGEVTKIVRSVSVGSETLGLPMCASLANTESAALLWLALFDLQHLWRVVTRLFRA